MLPDSESDDDVVDEPVNNDEGLTSFGVYLKYNKIGTKYVMMDDRVGFHELIMELMCYSRLQRSIMVEHLANCLVLYSPRVILLNICVKKPHVYQSVYKCYVKQLNESLVL